MLHSLQIVEPKAVYRQIGAHVRQLILSGQLAYNSRLPPTGKLAALWQTTPRTVQNALLPLVKEGLLIRVPKRGTFVRDRAAKLVSVGIYCREDFWASEGSLFQQGLNAALRAELKSREIEPDIWIDSRSPQEQTEPWQPLVDAAERREFQALIATTTDWPHYRWLNKLPMPTAFYCSANLPNAVRTDLRQFVDLGVGALASQGCKSIGFICPVSTARTDDGGMPNEYVLLFERFVEVCRERGLRLRNEWILARTADLAGKSDAQQGYELFHRLWRLPERPQGLLVFTDFHARGAIAAALELQARVPRKLKLAALKNVRVDLFCPFPATWIVSDEAEAARALVDVVERQFRGEEVHRRVIGFKLVYHKGDAQPRARRNRSRGNGTRLRSPEGARHNTKRSSS